MRPLGSWDVEETWRTFESGEFKQEYRGLELQKSQPDLDRYRALYDISRPDLIIETGTRYGASALWFRHELRVEVITIDVAPQIKPKHVGPGLESIRGSSISDWVLEILFKRVAGKRVMVSLDADHHSPHVQAEIIRLGALVTPGCYMVVEDACFDLFDQCGRPERAKVGGSLIPAVGGPLDAIEKTALDKSHIWDRDVDIEGMDSISHSPCGWWRRCD